MKGLKGLYLIVALINDSNMVLWVYYAIAITRNPHMSIGNDVGFCSHCSGLLHPGCGLIPYKRVAHHVLMFNVRCVVFSQDFALRRILLCVCAVRIRAF